MNFLGRFLFFRIMGWRFEGDFPQLNQFILAVVPHTHSMDFLIGLLTRASLGEQINYVGKKELFGPLTGWFFRALGGRAVDRGKNLNTVDAIAEVFKKNKVFRLALAPEGTRKRVIHLKTGFYHIAKQAKVPILPVGFDYKNKKVIFFPLFEPTASLSADFKKLEGYFYGIEGKIPEKSYYKTD